MNKKMLLGCFILISSLWFFQVRGDNKNREQEVRELEKITRSIVFANEDDISYGLWSYRALDGYLYLGSDEVGKGKQSLRSVGFTIDWSTGLYLPVTQLLAPGKGDLPEKTKITVNGEEKDGDSPLFDKKLSFLVTSGPYIVTVVDAEKNVYLLNPSQLGRVLFNCEKNLVDAAGAECGAIAGLGGSQGNVLVAAVAANGSTGWTDAAGVNRGFAVLKIEKEKTDDKDKGKERLVQGEHDNGTIGKGAAYLNLNADDAASPCAFSGDAGAKATLTDDIDIHYSAYFDTFFIGLGAKTDSAKKMGFLSVLRGKYNDGKITLTKILDGIDNTIIPDATNQIVGVFSDKDVLAAAYKVRIMHTTTGHDYLIIVGNTGPSTLANNNVYALPLMPKDHAKAGQLAKNDFSGVLDVASKDQILKTNVAVNVGKIEVDKRPTDIQIDGDTVYVSTETGIYQSAAIFDAKGYIAAWTQWQRVGGQKKGVLGFGFNNTTGDFVYLNDGKKIFGSTAWGKSEDVRKGVDEYSALTTVFDKIFPESNGGIFKIFDFSKNTPGFSTTDNFSMLVAVGENTVALVQTNIDNIAEWGPGKNIFVYSGDQAVVDAVNAFAAGSATLNADLKTIGPLTCAEVLRRKTTGVATDGYLYVGGFHGLVRLENPVGAAGWDSTGGLKAVATIKDFQFKKTPEALGWDDQIIFDIAADGKKLYLMTGEKLVKTKDVTAGEAAVEGASVEFYENFGSEIVAIPRWDGTTGAQLDESTVVFGTTAGLFVSIDNFATDAYQVPNLQGFPVKIVYLPVIKDAVDKDLTKGMLFVLAMDRDRDVSRLYRFAVDVSGADVTKILSPLDTLDDDVTLKSFIDYPDSRSDFSTDGSIYFSSRYYTQSSPNILQARTGGVITQRDRSLHALLDRNNDGFAHMAAPVRDSHSGMWLVSGLLRVNG